MVIYTKVILIANAKLMAFALYLLAIQIRYRLGGIKKIGGREIGWSSLGIQWR